MLTFDTEVVLGGLQRTFREIMFLQELDNHDNIIKYVSTPYATFFVCWHLAGSDQACTSWHPFMHMKQDCGKHELALPDPSHRVWDDLQAPQCHEG